MAVMSKVEYKGNLRTNAVHLRSGNTLITDAPVDNNGRGEAFSPTDLVATSLASCMITIMGIKAGNMGLEISGTKAEIVKIMTSGPRKISRIEISIWMPDGEFSKKDKSILENAAKTCPVALTLHSDVEQDINFHWS